LRRLYFWATGQNLSRFNRDIFWKGFKREFSSRVTQGQVNGLEFLLSAFERDPIWKDVRHIAYALSTIAIETAYTYQPIQEFGSRAYFERRYGSQTRKGRELGNDAPGEGAKYSGKGYVQLTGESNFEKMEEIIRRQNPQIITEFERRTEQRFDLTDFAEQAKDPQIAFLILTIGMFRGTFTGKAFNDYINSNKTDYVNARRIINGTDKANMIAGFAMKFEEILREAENKTFEKSPTEDEIEFFEPAESVPALSQNTANLPTGNSSNEAGVPNDIPTSPSQNPTAGGQVQSNTAEGTQIFPYQHLHQAECSRKRRRGLRG
jgi:putative chitinase